MFGEYLAAHHREVARLPQLTRTHLEGFLTYNHRRPWRGRVARDQPVAASVSKRTVVDLRAFFEDLAVWGWADRPPAPLIHPGDIPRLDRPLPRALAPDHDRNLMAAVAQLPYPFARHALTILRGTGLRLGELLDLELDCLLDFASHGSWLKVPLGKLATERTVPLDEGHPGGAGRLDRPTRAATGHSASAPRPARRLPVRRARPQSLRLPPATGTDRRGHRGRSPRPRRRPAARHPPPAAPHLRYLPCNPQSCIKCNIREYSTGCVAVVVAGIGVCVRWWCVSSWPSTRRLTCGDAWRLHLMPWCGIRLCGLQRHNEACDSGMEGEPGWNSRGRVRWRWWVARRRCG